MNNQSQLAVITGASSGIGKAIAEAFLEKNISVINADITTPVDAPASPHYHFIKTDISNTNQVQKLYGAVEKIGKPNLLVCNAGKGIHEKLSEGDPEKWAKVVDLNIMGTLRVLRSFLPILTNHAPPADIVFISSVAAKNPYEYGGVYSATKAAINMIAETLRLELKEKARITVVAPGVVDTNFFSNMESGSLNVESIGLGALQPGQVADAVVHAIATKTAQVVNYIELRPIHQTL